MRLSPTLFQVAELTYVRVLNPTNAYLQVPCDTRLGDFHPLGREREDDYTIVDAGVASDYDDRTIPSAVVARC